MFWRLFSTYLVLVLAAVGLLGLLVRHRSEEMFRELMSEVAVALAGVVVLATVAAFALARLFVRPLIELREGARKLADGDLGHKIRVTGGAEHYELAETFNAMSARLASTFRLLDHDREQLRAILSGMVEGVVAIDDQRRVLFANERAGQLLEFDPRKAVNQKLCDVTRLAPFHAIVEQGLTAAEPHREEFDVPGSGGRHLEVYVSRFPGQGMPGAVVVVNDTTEVRQAERMRQDFVANASHELKTPIAVIKSSVEALQDGAAEDPHTLASFLEQVARESDRMTYLVKDMLSLSRIESGSLGLEPRVVVLDREISDCMERHHPRADTKTLTLVEKPPPDAPANVAAWADPDALRQVMDNLVDNAIKYTPNGGRITVRWGATADTVSFEVEDTGVGIPEGDVNRVFERFYRVDRARGRAEGSTGLGLSIVKHLVQAMRGQVRVNSKLGKGTTFRVTLPRAGSA
ncbi:Sensor protein kinase WalK [Gemmata obscuriglobus]|uniref:histidine kinase n=1 Tax=Gemmata obscuriglobus TaxID=114 RepID=A0A2Z3H4P3_9BACT|nr:HAMP domain-containing sensor histidine kinase [Gemmata obscuriglobus]AWM40728.1 PAS domain-containing sensor histidine kinase [Gemmata obscuriglobus]QEG25999.1 Sensor protein kinase WalK [Gemmata obscuriglobus]VTS00278.1 multi-sensor signal transduction histidine kinase : Histidine kinase OS=Planctomyces maris DSM 8797 GN=PM8797T_06627 PE=4 SV=1: HAMP: PAS: HisKA: HATPase_c [Gemmata obscuriglobus UQM 2246]